MFKDSNYVGNEPFDFLKGCLLKNRKLNPRKIDLTLGELEQAILNGEWREVNN
jgi:hypothetical protein